MKEKEVPEIKTECTQLYCRVNGIPFDHTMDEEVLMDRVMEFVVNSYPEPEEGKKVKQYSCNVCEKMIRDEDRFCWYCGANTTDPEVPEGGYDWAKKEYATGVHVIDKTSGKKKETETEESEEGMKKDKEVSKKKKVADDEEEAPKKRGRPKKVKDEDEAEEPEDDEDEEEPEDDEDSDDSEDEDSDDSEDDSDDEDSEDDSDDEDSEDEEDSEDSEDEEEKPKKRGRPKGKGKLAAKKETEVEFETDESEDNSEADNSDLSLTDRVQKIRSLEDSQGTGAWEIGQHLDMINRKKLYKNSEFKKFNDFLEGGLHYCRATAFNYIKIYKGFTQDQAKRIGRTNLFEFCRKDITEKQKQKLIAMATDPEKPVTTREIKKTVQKMLGKDKVDKPKPNPFRSFLDTPLEGKLKGKEKNKSLIKINDVVGAEVEFGSKSVKLTFVQLEA